MIPIFTAIEQVEAEVADQNRAHIGRNLARRYWHAFDPTLIRCAMQSLLLFITPAANVYSPQQTSSVV